MWSIFCQLRWQKYSIQGKGTILAAAYKMLLSENSIIIKFEVHNSAFNISMSASCHGRRLIPRSAAAMLYSGV